ncbi:hypothetical protein H4219_001667 [Mycoemilia scoparia]|uniref:STAS domain-containing protein n=1 Tax=Mycoemilia scoparia TaxID=417184 RepID=A0A9W8DV17_9FUNG|nr:hypothetical protein H4219_001667 [Mycoemilia scoparia]
MGFKSSSRDSNPEQNSYNPDLSRTPTNAAEDKLAGSGTNSIEYIEPIPSVRTWVKDTVVPTKSGIKDYIISLFPIATWIYRYNLTWFIGDLVAGLTVGVVVIPQGMAYAKLAMLPPEFGLYSSFVGVVIYFMFATSKDITIGPVAVMSTLVGNILTETLPHLPQYKDTPWVIAGCLSIICGCIVTAIGLLRLGFIVDFIPLPAIAAFMTGSALNIAMGQIPALMGNNSNKNYNTRAPTYLVFGNFFKYIKDCNLNAAIGLTALFLLYLIRFICNYGSKRWPQYKRHFFFASTLRTVFVILLYTLISWLINRGDPEHPKISILKTIPRGFKHMGVPVVNSTIISEFAGKLPPAVIVLLIEHISISKSFGRVNNYTINPNQELIAIGVTNLLGPFFGAYPATGSFSRTAIKSKAGVRTPLAGLITGIMVVIAIYALPPVFYYISNALLAAVIIHAVGDLITAPKTIMSFWKISPFEFIIFWAGVLVSIFSSIDNGIYTTVIASAVLTLFRIAKAKGRFIGRILVYEQVDNKHGPKSPTLTGKHRNVYVPLDHSDGTNPAVRPQATTSQGIFIYRISEAFLYPNATHFTDHMVAEITKQSRPGNINPYGSLGNRPWNDPGPRHKTSSHINTNLPELRAIILDFSGVPHIDVTSTQNLVDVRKQLDRHADCSVAWHFAGIQNTWIKRSLISAGFGGSDDTKTVFSVASVGVKQDYDVDQIHTHADGLTRPLYKSEHENSDIANLELNKSTVQEARIKDYSESPSLNESNDNRDLEQTYVHVPILGVNRANFHIDLDEAIRAAESELRPGSVFKQALE